MCISSQLAKQLRDAYFGGNWTAVNLRDTVAGLTWQQAVAKVYGFNSIVALVYHTNYYVQAISSVLRKEPLESHDRYSFNHPPVRTEADWQALLSQSWADAESLASMMENFPSERLGEIFVNESYGTYLRNFSGVVEHLHYHLGQIVLIKKILTEHTAHSKLS